MNWLFLIGPGGGFGGLESRSRTLAISFADKGHRVVLGYAGANCYGGLERRCDGRIALSAISVDARRAGPLAVYRASTYLRHQQIDAVMCFSVRVPLFPAFLVASRLVGVGHTVVHHGASPESAPRGLGSRRCGGILPGCHFRVRAKRLADRWLACRSVSHALFNNTAEEGEWLEAYRYPRANRRLWLPPVDYERFSKERLNRRMIRKELGVDRSMVFGFVGRLVQKKAVDDLLVAFRTVCSKVRNARLMIVGDGGERPMLEALARDLGLSNQVQFCGAQQNVERFYAAMDIFVLPSRRDESLGISILESMAAGVPVIVTDMPGPRRVVQDGKLGMVVPKSNPAELARTMMELASDGQRQEWYTSGGLERVRDCCPHRVGADLLEWLSGTAASEKGYTGL